jgi:DNA-binding SARP family transcriptional activator/DNA-binding transcriptional ArsR family regulator
MAILRVSLLGSLMVTWGKTPLSPIAGTAARSLFAYLLTYRNRPHTRDLLAGTFWPDLADAVARRRLSQALWQIRKALNPHPVLLTEGDMVQINPDLPLWLDTEEFARHRAEGASGESSVIEHYALCLEYYQGDFLAGYYDDWLFPERERLREQFLEVLGRLVVGCKRQGDYATALAHARRLAAEDPLREEAHREVMRLCHLLGRGVEAVQQFETCRQVLAEELGVEPSPETTNLAQEIAARSGQAAQLDLSFVRPPSAAFVLDSPRGPKLPLVGREAERAEILTHVEALLQGLGGVVLLEGEAGVGKTRLLRAIAGDAEWRGAEVLWGSGRQAEADAPFGLLVEALSGRLSPLRARQFLQVVEEIWLQVLAVLLPPLAAALPDLRPPPALEPGQERDRLVNALAQLLAGWAQAVPLLLVVEDLHWAGADTLDLLARLAPSLSEGGVLVLGSYRREEARALPETWQGLQALDRAGVRQRLVLERLNAAATGELVRRSLGLGSPAPLFEARLFKETVGNPLFLLETLRALHGEGLLVRDKDGQWSTQWDDLTSDYAELPLPPAVEQIIARRLDRLPASLRRTVQLAAVQGERLDFDLLRAAGDEPPSGLLAGLRDLVQRRFLDETEEDYGFHHDKIRQVAYDSIEAAERRRLHGRVAQALESLQPARVAALAHHWSGAEVWDKAATYHHQAGDRAREVYANAEAAAHYTRALEALEQLPGSPEPAQLFELRWTREEVRARLGEREGQRDDLAVLETLARQLGGDRRRMRVGMRKAEYHLDTGDPSAARICLERILVLAQAGSDQKIEAWGLNLLGQAHHQLGNSRLTREYNEQALALYRAGGDRMGQAKSLASCCVACLFSGDYLAAQEYGQEALLLSRTLGDRRAEGHALHLLSRIHRDLGQLAAARECATQAVSIAREVGFRYFEAYNLLELGNLYSNLGDYASAQETLKQAGTIFEQIADWRGYGYALLDLGLVSHFLGNGDLARAHVEQASSLLSGAGDRWGEAGCLTYLGLILEGLGNLDAAAEAFHQALSIKREIDQQAWSLEDLAGLTRAALARRRPDEAMEHITGVLDWIDQEGIAGIEHPLSVYLTAYRVLTAGGRVGRAQEILTDAYQLVMERAGKLDDEGLRRSFLENVAEHRAIWDAYRELNSRTMAACLPRLDAPSGRPLGEDETVTVTWTVAAPEDEALEEGPARRQARCRRLLQEAADQGAAPTVGDLAAALAVSEPTVRRDLAALRRAGHRVRTRGSRGG